MPLVWDRSYEIGIAIVDSQHRRLVQLIAALQQSMAGGQGQAALDGLFDQLFDYAYVHFVTEEQIMEDARYPLMDTHRVQHRKLLSCLETLRRKHTADTGVLSLEVLDFLQSWLGRHTLGDDATMARYVVSVRGNPRLDLLFGSGRTPLAP
ncbi:MAG: bacteriohemerythrin [Acidobacteria bacterium]|nr:bacteriohemerythrin [Acidobacteriota bacterium]